VILAQIAAVIFYFYFIFNYCSSFFPLVFCELDKLKKGMEKDSKAHLSADTIVIATSYTTAFN